MDRPLRFAVFGAGVMGANHARILDDYPGCELVYVVDPSYLGLEVAYRNHAEWIQETEDLGEIDAAIVAVPTSLHSSVACWLMKRGVPVLVEKPIASTLLEAHLMLAVSEQENVPLAVGHVERFNPAVQALQLKLMNDEVGRVFQMAARRLSPFPARVGDAGVAADLATHDLDIMCILAGNPVRLSSEIERKAHSKHEDLLVATMRFESGIIGLLEVNWLTPTKIRQLTVTGERGMFVVDYLQQRLTLFENAHESETWPALDIFDGVTEGNVIRFAIDRVEPLRAQLGEFVKLVRGEPSRSVTGADGARALRLAAAIVNYGQGHGRFVTAG